MTAPNTPPFRAMPFLTDSKLSGWLQQRVTSRVIYAAGLLLDALSDVTIYAVKARFPSTAQPDALPYLARDRNLDRGPTESDASIISRITMAFDTWATAGHPRELLTNVLAYLSPSTPVIRIVTDLSIWDTVSGGVWSRTFGAANWNWDGATKWWRAWPVILSSPFTKTRTWGDGGKWGQGLGSWGSSATSSQVIAIRNIVKKWKSANNVMPAIIFSPSGSMFDPTQPQGGGINPDGSWGRPYKSVAGVATPTRPSTVVFWDGVT